MDYVNASEINEPAEVNVSGSHLMLGDQPRDIYLYVQPINMPDRVASSSDVDVVKLLDSVKIPRRATPDSNSEESGSHESRAATHEGNVADFVATNVHPFELRNAAARRKSAMIASPPRDESDASRKRSIKALSLSPAA